MIARYGDAIEADLHRHYHVDLLDLWRDRLMPRTVTNLIAHLPRDSHYQAALANDEDLVGRIAEQPSGPPPLTDFTPEVERLTIIADRIGELTAWSAAQATGKKQKPPKPLPWPITARERARQHERRRKHDLIRERLASARAAGKSTMSKMHADATHATTGATKRRR